jgi:glucose-6-phosphate 1-dehydrogenase
MAESFGVESRGDCYGPVGALRDVVVNHLMQVLAAAMEAPAGHDADTMKDQQASLWRAMPDADPAHYVRGQYDGCREIPGVAPDSDTETYAALRVEVRELAMLRGAVFIRTGKRLPVSHTEVRLIFRAPPRLNFLTRTGADRLVSGHGRWRAPGSRRDRVVQALL